MHGSRRHVQDKKCMYCHGNFGPAKILVREPRLFRCAIHCVSRISCRSVGEYEKTMQDNHARGEKKSRNNSIPWPYSPNPNTNCKHQNSATVVLLSPCRHNLLTVFTHKHMHSWKSYKYTRKINMQGCSNNTGCFFLSYIIIWHPWNSPHYDTWKSKLCSDRCMPPCYNHISLYPIYIEDRGISYHI